MTHGLRPSPPRLPAGQAFTQFEATLQAEGLRSALAYLLCLSGFDCIGIYRAEAGPSAVLVHVDRRCAAASLQALPDEVLLACHLRDERGVLTTWAAARGLAPPSSGPSRCCSLPVLDPEGRLLGSLCHHADQPRSGDELDLLLLLQATSAIARGAWLDGAADRSPAGLAAA